MVVVLKVGGQAAAAECLRAAITQQGLPWKLVHVATLNQARLALARERVDLLLVHHQLPDGAALDADLPVASALRVLSIELGLEAIAAQALDQGYDDYVIESVSAGFAEVMVAQIRSAFKRRELDRTLHQQHGLLASISRAQASMLAGADVGAVCQNVLNEVMALTNAGFGLIAQVQSSGVHASLRMQACACLNWDATVLQQFQTLNEVVVLPQALPADWADAMATGQPVIASRGEVDMRAWGIWKGLPALPTVALIPVGERKRVDAWVCLGQRANGFGDSVLAFVRPLLDTLGGWLEVRRTEHERAQAARVLQTTLDSISQGVMMVDVSGHVALCNARALELLDLPADLLDRKPHYTEVTRLQLARGDFGPHGEWVSDPMVRDYINRPVEPRVLPLRYSRRTRDGKVLDIQRNVLGDGTEMFTYTDVTSVHESQRELRASNERLAATIDGTRAGTWEWNIQTDEVDVNERFAELVGYRHEELPRQVSQLYQLLLHPADEDRLKEANRLHISGERDHYECQFRFRHKSGKWIWVHERGRINFRTPDGLPLVMSGITLDVTDSKYAEDALRVATTLLKERTDALETTLHAMSQGLMVVSTDGRIRLYNEQVCRILDMPDSFMSTMPLLTDLVRRQQERGDFGPGMTFVQADAREYVQSGAGAVDDTVPRRYVRRTAKGRHLEIKSDPLPSGGFVRTFTDVTSFVEAVDMARERGQQIRQLNETLEQRVKQRTLELERTMHDIEALSYSIAHDLRGPLRAVNGYAALILSDEAERLSAQGRELFERITEASRRMGVMITDLLELFKVMRADIHPVDVDLAAVAQETVRALAAGYPRTEVDVTPMPLAQGDTTLLRVLMHNLLDNALKYSSKELRPHVVVGWNPTLEAWFVQDNGVGFDMAHADKLFGLFQRLHMASDFEGTGVGLAVVARVVERHGGRIWAESQPGQGATFWFTLVPQEGAVEKLIAAAPPPAQGGLFDA